MNFSHFPALQRSASQLSRSSQSHFFNALRLHLILLLAAATLSALGSDHWSVAFSQAIVILGAIFCAVYLAAKRPERDWYAGRAVAESIKTVTWRFVCRAEPFLTEDGVARAAFAQKLRAIVEQNTETARALTAHLGGAQITEEMVRVRSLGLEERKRFYAANRIRDQLRWYAHKAASSKSAARLSFIALIAVNACALVLVLVRIRFPEASHGPVEVLLTGSAALISWMQARRYSELSASYALAAHEIGLIQEASLSSVSDEEFSGFVGDAENAFSREHTQWVARKDI